MKSIKDIALKANVSIGTVDRVLHNRPGVSEKTKKKVLKIIEDYNYTVNPVASILASKKTYTIATLLPENINSDEFWESPKQGISNAMEEIKNLGFLINNFHFNQFSSKTYIDAFHKMVNSKPSAVLIAPIFNKETKELIGLLENENIPYVFINTETEGLNNLSFIGQDSFKSGLLAGKLMNWVLPKKAEILIIEIRKDISNYTSINKRINGFKDFFKTSKKSITIHNLHFEHIENSETLKNQLSNYLSEHTHIKGIFVPSSKVSAVAKIVESLDRNDIEIGGFDTTDKNIKYLKNGTVDFLISQKPIQQGYDGIKLLFNYLTHQIKPEKYYFSPIEIVLKENVDFL